MANDGNLYSLPADVTITVSACLGDFEPVGDIDGLDLSNLPEGQGSISIADFAENFGKIGCP